jgi:hypothetical protein
MGAYLQVRCRLRADGRLAQRAPPGRLFLALAYQGETLVLGSP